MHNPKDIESLMAKSREEFDGSNEAVHKYMREQINSFKQDVDYAYEQYQAELKRTKEKNEWMEQLLQSLENM
jgi:cell division septum initiation protein DivIVA